MRRFSLALTLGLAVACAPAVPVDTPPSAAEPAPAVDPVAAEVPVAPEAPVAPVATMDEEAAVTAEPAPDVPIKVRITGDEWRWIVRYSGSDGTLDTDDDVLSERHLRLAAGTNVTIDLASNDYIYTFYVPQLDIMEVAAPSSPYELELETGPAGVHDLLGSQMCGFTHPELLGDVIVQERAEFADWLDSQGG